MKLTLVVPDELYDKFSRQAGSDVVSEVADFMVARLEQFSDVDPREGWMHLDPKLVKELEAEIQCPLPNPGELRRRVAALAAIRFGEVRLQFTPGQLAEIKYRAERNGESVQAYTERCVRTIEPMIFTGAGAGEVQRQAK